MAELLRTSRAAARAGGDEEAIRHYIRNGTQPAQTTPRGQYRIHPADLAAFLAERSSPPWKISSRTTCIQKLRRANWPASWS